MERLDVRVSRAGVRGGRAPGGRAALCFGEDEVAQRCMQTELPSVGNRKCFVPVESAPFSTQPQFACHSPDSATLLSMGAMFSPGRAALAKCYGLE